MELKLNHAQELELFYKNKWQSAESKLSEVRKIRPGSFSQNNKQLRYVDDIIAKIYGEMALVISNSSSSDSIVISIPFDLPLELFPNA